MISDDSTPWISMAVTGLRVRGLRWVKIRGRWRSRPETKISREYATWYVTSATNTMTASAMAATSMSPGKPEVSRLPTTPVTGIDLVAGQHHHGADRGQQVDHDQSRRTVADHLGGAALHRQELRSHVERGFHADQVQQHRAVQEPGGCEVGNYRRVRIRTA